jgi:hypothetical protein
MTAATTNPLPNVSPPPNAVCTRDWQPDGNRFYRNFEGEERHLDEAVWVFSHGTQHDDGRIDDGTTDPVFRAPGISIDVLSQGWRTESGITLTGDTARRLADLLVMAADELDGWVTR